MPPAKRPAARTTRSGSTKKASTASTRREVERAIKRFEKALEDANSALQALGKDASKGAKSAYRDMTKALTALRRDAVKTNKALMKDLEKLGAAAVAPARTASSRTTTKKPTASRSSSRATTKRSTASRRAS
ncbi:MAG: hypothetical protein WBP81_22520 [Solirubrobacteraceae bacterium]